MTKVISPETEQVNDVTLASFIETEKLQHIDLIKFNCEVAESGIIINTAAEILRKIKCILILYHGYLKDSISKEQMAN
jgi:hypothetical protein